MVETFARAQHDQDGVTVNSPHLWDDCIDAHRDGYRDLAAQYATVVTVPINLTPDGNP